MSRKCLQYATFLSIALGVVFLDIPAEYPLTPPTPAVMGQADASGWQLLARKAKSRRTPPSAPLAGRTAYAGGRRASGDTALLNPRTAQHATNHRLIYGLLFGVVLGWTWRTYRIVGKGIIPESIVE